MTRTVVYPVSPRSTYYVAAGYLATGDAYGGRADYHTGIDLNLKTGGDSDLGKPVFAVADGVVQIVHTAPGPGFGLIVVIYHPQFGVWTRYAHLQGAQVKAGQVVKAGQKIASIGKSGMQKYAHLHLDVFKKRPGNWRDWPGRDRVRVLSFYADPSAWLAQVEAVDRSRLGVTA